MSAFLTRTTLVSSHGSVPDVDRAFFQGTCSRPLTSSPPHASTVSASPTTDQYRLALPQVDHPNPSTNPSASSFDQSSCRYHHHLNLVG